MDGLTINAQLLRGILTRFIHEEVCKIGLKKGVLGLSGGIDSAVVAFLAAEALGPQNVCACILPYKTSSPESMLHARMVVEQLKIHSLSVDITPAIDAYFSIFTEADMVRRGNKMARERMSILYDQSAARSALVLGTSNKSELLLGYGTIFGDMASALNPIGDLYKSQVRQLAEALGVPKAIIEKKPSADLWEGQTDEQELGFTYSQVDQLLYCMVDLRLNRAELIDQGFAPAFIDAVYGKVQNSHFKRRLSVIAKVSNRTIDRDFRYARDWGM
jgi:NAD+ synthase